MSILSSLEKPINWHSNARLSHLVSFISISSRRIFSLVSSSFQSMLFFDSFFRLLLVLSACMNLAPSFLFSFEILEDPEIGCVSCSGICATLSLRKSVYIRSIRGFMSCIKILRIGYNNASCILQQCRRGFFHLYSLFTIYHSLDS